MKRILVFIFIISIGFSIAGSPKKGPANATNPNLTRLLEGNGRFINGKMTHPDVDADRRTAISGTQHPFAVVLFCSDSRVPPELIFDQGLGDLFVIRTAGNLVDSIELGSIEYAVEHLGVNLVLVLGHENCGVIKAFLQKAEPEGHVKKLTDEVSKEPEIQDALKAKGDTVDNCVRANIKHITRLLRNSRPTLMEKYESASLTIVGARYGLNSGRVEIIE